MTTYYCSSCKWGSEHKGNYEAHLKSQKHKDLEQVTQDSLKNMEKLKKQVDDQSATIQDLKIDLDKQKESYECQLHNRSKIYEKRLLKELELTTKCSMLERENERLVEIIKKPINIVNNQTNYKTINKILNIISPEVIDYSQVRKYITAEVASNGPEAMANTVHKYLLMNTDGKPKVVCTDPSRNKFKIKDSTTGDLIDDINLEIVKLNIKDNYEFRYMKEDAIHTAHLKAVDGELAQDLAMSYMHIMRLKGKTGRFLRNKIKQYYVSTSKVQFTDK